MQIDKKAQEYEEKRLLKVMEQIHNNLEACEVKIDEQRAAIKEINKNMLSEFKFETDSTVNLEGAATMHHYQTMGLNTMNAMDYQIGKQAELRKLETSSYFAKIIFAEEGSEEEEVYLGSSSLIKDNAYEYLIYDWRAPICSIFYDYEKGEVEYSAPGGTVSGELISKRHFKIENGEIIYMFDSNINIMDDMLKEALAKSVNDKMSTIITTIQKEQNQVIRDEEADVLVVSGSAGSGKTSIALHRIAYLLYQNRKKILTSDILIFTPNDIFSDYISHVLPELGEKNVESITFNDYIMDFIKNLIIPENLPEDRTSEEQNANEGNETNQESDEAQEEVFSLSRKLGKVESYYDQMEYLLSPVKDEAFEKRIDSMTQKSSLLFFDALDQYIKGIETRVDFFEDLYYKNHLIISAEDIQKAYLESVGIIKCSSRLMQVKNRLTSKVLEIRRAAAYTYKQSLINSDEYFTEHDIKVKTKRYVKRQFKGLNRKIRKMTNLDYIQVYNQFLETRGLETIESEAHFEDALCLAYIKGRLAPIRDVQKVKHLVIDESQDYTLLHYKIIRMIFGHCKYTLLGDPNQAIHPYISSKVSGDVEDFLGEHPRHIRLTKTYRSTRQISDFCSKILPNTYEVENILRDGKEPLVEAYKGLTMETVKHQVEHLKTSGCQSIAIIGKTKKHCEMLYEQLTFEEQGTIGLLNHEDQLYKSGVIIIPSFLAKGLEFDGVIVVCDDIFTYDEERERQLFYTVCTRALHDLTLLYTKEKPKLLQSKAK